MILGSEIRIFDYPELRLFFCELNIKGGDWLRQGSEGHRGMPGYCLPENKRKLNTTADSFEYALAA